MKSILVFWVWGCFIWLPLCGFSQDTIPASKDSLPYAGSHFVTIQDVTLHYRTQLVPYHSQKGSILLVHGFCASTYSWRKNLGQLTQAGYNVIAIDLPGFGYSSISTDFQPTNTNNALLLWKLLQHVEQQNQSLQSDRWHLAGHSMGGGIVAMMAQLRPQEVATLTIVNGALYDNQSYSAFLFKFLFQIPPFGKVFRWGTRQIFFNHSFIQKVIKNSYGHPPDSTVVKRYLHPLQENETAYTIIKMATSYDSLDLKLQHIYSPTHLIWGENDELITAHEAQSLKKTMPNAQLDIIKDSKHCPMETAPLQFHQTFLPFLNKYRSPPTASP